MAPTYFLWNTWLRVQCRGSKWMLTLLIAFQEDIQRSCLWMSDICVLVKHFFHHNHSSPSYLSFPQSWSANFSKLVIAIFVNLAYHQYARGYNFPIRTTPKKISVSELGVIFRGSPLFLALSGHSHVRGISTLNFGPISTKLGGTVRAIKKWPRRTTDPVRAGITEKRAFLRSAEKWFLA